MFSTSQDVYNLIKGISLSLFVVFLCIGLFYAAMILRQVYMSIKEMRLRIKKVDEIAHAFKEKIENSASYLFLISEGIKKIIDVIGSYEEKREKKNKKKD